MTLSGRSFARIFVRGLLLALLGAVSACYVAVPTTALAPRATARLEAREAFQVHQRTDAGFVPACRARSVEGTVAAVRGDSVEFHSLWIRQPVADGPRCVAGRVSLVVVSDVRGASEPLRRRSEWRTVGLAAVAIPLMLIALYATACEVTVCT